MPPILVDLFNKARAHFAPFADARALVLIALCAGVVFMIDPALAKTVLQWAFLFGAFLGGIVIASRYMLPHVRLSQHVVAALSGNTAAGLVVLGVCVFMGALAIAIATWGRP